MDKSKQRDTKNNVRKKNRLKIEKQLKKMKIKLKHETSHIHTHKHGIDVANRPLRANKISHECYYFALLLLGLL